LLFRETEIRYGPLLQMTRVSSLSIKNMSPYFLQMMLGDEWCTQICENFVLEDKQRKHLFMKEKEP